jgi:cyclopropane-fatty-acyl-phospholipid synthase
MSSQLLDVPHKHPSSIWSFADNTLTLVREAVLTAGYGPLTTLAEKAVVSYEPPFVLSYTLLLALILTEPSAFYEISPSAVYESSPASIPMNSLSVVRMVTWRRSRMLS